MLDEMVREGIISRDFYVWLIANGFKTAPASTKYHGAFNGGLYEHSSNVTRELLHLTDRLDLEWQRKESPWIIGMFHDLCKIDAYTVDASGHYERVEDSILKGHGAKSVMLLSRFITLTEEEILCITYHMGAYETDNWKQFDLAIKKYPNVLFTHTPPICWQASYQFNKEDIAHGNASHVGNANL